MTDSPAARLAGRKSTRPMPAIVIPAEGQPAVTIGNKRSAKRPHVINTPVSDRTHKLLDDLTYHFRQRHGRSWRMNTTVEHAIEALARQVGLAGSERGRD